MFAGYDQIARPIPISTVIAMAHSRGVPVDVIIENIEARGGTVEGMEDYFGQNPPYPELEDPMPPAPDVQTAIETIQTGDETRRAGSPRNILEETRTDAPTPDISQSPRPGARAPIPPYQTTIDEIDPGVVYTKPGPRGRTISVTGLPMSGGTFIDEAILPGDVLSDPVVETLDDDFTWPDYDPPSAGVIPASSPVASPSPPTKVNPANDSGGPGEQSADDATKKLNAIQRFARDKLGWDEDKRSDMSTALMQAGFAMMASKNPSALGAIGEGGMAGVAAYKDEEEARLDAEQEAALLAMKQEKHALEMAGLDTDLKKANAELEKYMNPTFDPFENLSSTHRSKLEAEALYKNGFISKEVYENIMGIEEDPIAAMGG